jgi:hypothetical protein
VKVKAEVGVGSWSSHRATPPPSSPALTMKQEQ